MLGSSGVAPDWNVPVNLVGERVEDAELHFCDHCDHPILIYGRIIPCKHVFCYNCAKNCEHCIRCSEAVVRVERCEPEQIFVCAHGAPRHSYEACRRTYLSQRDLDAHINHRHKPTPRFHSGKSSKPTRPEEAAHSSPISGARANLITIQLQPKS